MSKAPAPLMVYWMEEFKDEAGDHAANEQGEDGAPERGFIAFKVVDHHDGGGWSAKLSMVDPDREAHHVEDEDEPAVGVGFVALSSHLRMAQKTRAVKKAEEA